MEAVYRRAFDVHPIEDLVHGAPDRGLAEKSRYRQNAFDLCQLYPAHAHRSVIDLTCNLNRWSGIAA